VSSSAARGAVACGHEPDQGYRLGRWARLALTVTVVGAAAVVVAVLLSGPAAVRVVDVTVSPGDTLWGIAAAAAPDRDPRAVVAEIRDLNGLRSDLLPVGVVLRVPTSG
jgi:LysM repeat protein